ncbi:helix-turn-helix domain-containing protein [Corynebacterium renale]|uniref:DNA-binding XRE family transcriptional regulator n=1 Tax=Corynebacterium renale TaxID=1724 RepID=A0A2A9DQ84_9CORY|nr:helix-turn-helix transcriptional regulator [Corynebacterium renale]PFG28541.1 DNA-binding XRE family transcriptional regulator [Corynebacterium renale]SQI26241.1 transcriptional regulator [Corynebacterium renale]
MATQTSLYARPHGTSAEVMGAVRFPEPLLREALGEALRSFRAEKHTTLRQLAKAANVSPGYISELERGRKEVSSELLASICSALDASVADVLIEAASTMALANVNVSAELNSPTAPREISAQKIERPLAMVNG